MLVSSCEVFSKYPAPLNKQILNENKLIEQVLANIRKRETAAIPYMHIRRKRRVVVSFAMCL